MSTTDEIVLQPPPANARIPSPPAGYTNANRSDYRAHLPCRLELAAMPDVLVELARFSSYAEVFGQTVPPLIYVLNAFTAATEWSTMRVQIETWDRYARSQQGAAWSDVRAIMRTLTPAFRLAVRMSSTLERKYPALARLFEARKIITARGLVTRKANQKDRAEGREPSHGYVAKRAQKRAARLALMKAQSTDDDKP